MNWSSKVAALCEPPVVGSLSVIELPGPICMTVTIAVGEIPGPDTISPREMGEPNRSPAAL